MDSVKKQLNPRRQLLQQPLDVNDFNDKSRNKCSGLTNKQTNKNKPQANHMPASLPENQKKTLKYLPQKLPL